MSSYEKYIIIAEHHTLSSDLIKTASQSSPIDYFSPSCRKEQDVRELFEAIEKLRTQFESIERPHLEIETPPGAEAETPSYEKQQDSTSAPAQGTDVSKAEKDEEPKSSAVKADQVLDDEAELTKLESEFGKPGQDDSPMEVSDWEFAELERELAYANSASSSQGYILLRQHKLSCADSASSSQGCLLL